VATVAWTEGRIKGYITSVIRKGFTRWPDKYEALKKAYLGKKLNQKTGRMANHYRCSSCQGSFVNTDIEVDHIHPVVDVKVGFVSWDEYIKRLYCKASELQVLCKPCHKAKSAHENAARRENKGKK
jgi:5-methylcytosine-specific restriction endonuclease McrA